MTVYQRHSWFKQLQCKQVNQMPAQEYLGMQTGKHGNNAANKVCFCTSLLNQQKDSTAFEELSIALRIMKKIYTKSKLMPNK